MLTFLAGLLFLVAAALLFVAGPHFIIWVAYDRHGYYRMLEDRRTDNAVFGILLAAQVILIVGCLSYGLYLLAISVGVH